MITTAQTDLRRRAPIADIADRTYWGVQEFRRPWPRVVGYGAAILISGAAWMAVAVVVVALWPRK